MSNVGRSQAGNTLIGQGVTNGPRFAPIGTDCGLTEAGIVIAHGTDPFTASDAGSNGQVLIGATGADPAFGTITSTGATISFTLGANTLNMEAGGAVPTTFTADSGSATPAANNLNVLGASTAAGTSPVATSGAGSTLTVNVQKSQAIAATDATKVGLANFNSAQFSVDANGFVSVSATGVATTITGDSGGALSPASNNWNILGGPGVTTSGSGSTLTINSVVFTDQAGSTSVTSDSGSFATAAITLTLPASPAQGEVCEFVATSAAALIVDAPSTHLIRIGNAVSSAGGTATSGSLAGDALVLRYRSSNTTWYATSVIGNWTTA